MNKDLSPLQQELLSRADSVLASIGNAVGKATDFAAQQLPDIGVQFIAYGRAYTSIVTLSALVVFIVGLYLIVRVATQNSWKAPNSMWNGWAESRSAALVCGGFLSFLSFLVVASHMKEFLMVWFAPKIWLIQEIVKIVK